MVNAVEFYVSPNGSDANPGTLSQPFRALGRAREAVRELKLEGDGVHWGRVLRESFREDRFDENEYRRILLEDPSYRPDRIFFGCAPGGLACATASAYRKERFGPDTGYLHYLAVTPAHTGKGLGIALSVTVLHQFRAEGLKRAVLQTQDHRVPAINLYLRLGFRPLLADADDVVRESWRTTYARLGRPWPEEP